MAQCPVSLALRWLVDGVDDAPSSGKVKGSTGRRKALLASNFRVAGLPFGDDAVSAVDLPTLQVDWAQDHFSGGRQRLQMAQRRLGELAITITSRRRPHRHADAALRRARHPAQPGLTAAARRHRVCISFPGGSHV